MRFALDAARAKMPRAPRRLLRCTLPARVVEHPFIFIAGLHRSGTSLLHEVLREHPRISGFRDTGVWEDEGQHLQGVYPTAQAFGGPGRFAFDRRSHMDETHELATEDSARRLFGEWKRHLDPSRDFALEKSPPTIVRMRFFQRLFPRARFVVLLRHPLAVGYATQKWTGTTIRELLDHTLLAYEVARRDAEVLERNSPGCAMFVRYEDFARSPQQEIDRICAFLGLEPVQVRHEVRADANARYLAMWSAERRSLWRRLLRRDLPLDLEPRVASFGYSLHEPERLRALG